jgi:hypothetical protein
MTDISSRNSIKILECSRIKTLTCLIKSRDKHNQFSSNTSTNNSIIKIIHRIKQIK